MSETKKFFRNIIKNWENICWNKADGGGWSYGFVVIGDVYYEFMHNEEFGFDDIEKNGVRING